MFGFLKNKIKEWVGKSKEKLEETQLKEETEEEKQEEEKEKPEQKKEKKKQEKTKEIKQEQKSKKQDKKSKKEKEIKEETKKEIQKQTEIKAKKEAKEEIETKEKKKIEESEEYEKESEEKQEKQESEVKEQKKGFFAKLKEKFIEPKKEEAAEEIKETDERIEEVKEEEVEEFEKEIEKVKKQEIEEVPLEFNIATEKYQPDLKEIRQGKSETKEITQEPEQKKGFFSRLKESFKYKITQEEFNSIFDDLEMLLLENNVALEVVDSIKKSLSEELLGKEIKKEDLESVITNALKNSIEKILINPQDPIKKIKEKKKIGEPFVILFFGINGTGKTTSIAKLAHLLKENKLSCVLAAADTFRAASIEQIKIHADKLGVPLIKHDYGSDPAAVGFDAITYAKKHKIDAVLIDTAGRMHTKTNLLQEMEKIVRVNKPDMKIFVAESIAGNDATEQAKAFNEIAQIDGSILSKADVDQKGGTIISIGYVTKKPILYLGTGQKYEDLELFDKEKFIEKLGL
ncbi:MAG: signal recognition particle-docking protein FtsY [Candidatus Nanoarchaeia archaeon]